MGGKVFVTGGTGLVGSHVLLNLVIKGINVRALKRKNSDIKRIKKIFSFYSGEADELFRRIDWFEGDILDISSLETALKDIEIIYHCAGTVSFESRKRREMIHNNVTGTANLVNAALSCGVKRICHVSSISALGKTLDDSPVSETTSWIPAITNSGYSESKFLSESEIWRGVEEGLDAVVVNPSIIVGPGNWENSSVRFFPLIDKGFRFYTGGITGFVDVRDVADAIILLTEKQNFNRAKNQRFLLSGENLEYRVFFNQIADALHKPRPSVGATGIMLGLAWRVAAFWSLVSGNTAWITKETVISSIQKNNYDGSKITRLFGFTYHPIQQAVRHTASCYERENQENQA
jgi:dihydroflavonol-4-reductase